MTPYFFQEAVGPKAMHLGPKLPAHVRLAFLVVLLQEWL